MPTERIPGKSSTRRYAPAEKEQAVRLVRKLRDGLGTEHDTVQRVASQLGNGVELVRSWVRPADIDDCEKPGTSFADAEAIRRLEQENKELKRANETGGSDRAGSAGSERLIAVPSEPTSPSEGRSGVRVRRMSRATRPSSGSRRAAHRRSAPRRGW